MVRGGDTPSDGRGMRGNRYTGSRSLHGSAMSKLERVEEGVLRPLEKALYRNQFILGPTFIDEFSSWKRAKIRNSICLSTHPDLNVYQAIQDDKSITLIGYIVDPDRSNASDRDIVNDLISKISNFDALLDHSGKFGGRWILIIDDGEQIRLFHDAVGLRQVFYTDTDCTTDLWCASQPRLIADRLNLRVDPIAVDFISSFGQRNSEYWWPGDSCPYKEIKHLLPNHYLDFKVGSSHRYWPNGPLKNLSLNEATGKTATIMLGLLESMANRYDLAVSLTAGWDSRLVLAAAKGIRDRVSYVTVKQGRMTNNHPDITIPSLLMSKFGLRHDIVESPAVMDEQFMPVFNRHVSFAHEVWGPDAQAIMEYSSHRKVAVTGSASEAARCFYGPMPKRRMTPQSLSARVGMGNDPFAVRSFEKWLKGIPDTFNYNLLDLFYWEQRGGNWLAMCQSEFDIAWRDIFTPFNCRNLLMNMLGVEENYRKPPKYELYTEVMLQLWPEILSAPINPHKQKNMSAMLKSSLRNQLRRYTPDFIIRALRGR